ncbi:MAG TPA: hypothetical protein P5081_13085 [Phycisphaerae bacterium]|nr:hypothetical protein [Phycisphaerae bacterium]
MLLQCPNCRRRVSFYRSIITPAWSSFPCAGCGSTLSVSFARRIMAAALWAAIFLFAGEYLGISRWGRLISYALLGVSLIITLYLFEKIILVDRREFTCLECGYNLKGLTESRCPECGAAFDPSEIEQIRARIGLRRAPPKGRWMAIGAVLLLAAFVTGSFIAWRNMARRAPTTTTTSAPASAPAL